MLNLDLPSLELIISSLERLPSDMKSGIIYNRTMDLVKRAKALSDMQYQKSQERITKASTPKTQEERTTKVGKDRK